MSYIFSPSSCVSEDRGEKGNKTKMKFAVNHKKLCALLLLLINSALLCRALMEGDGCTAGENCGRGLHCSTCSSQCTRAIAPMDPKLMGKDLPFNKYSWLTTHNSYAISGAKPAFGSILLAQTNQEDSITAQLNNGVRGLMVDMYDFQNGIWQCHSIDATCFNFTAFQPAINVLKEIERFLRNNPSEVITIFIEDYVESPQGLTQVFNASGLDKYFFPTSEMPKNGEDWPLLSEMISKNQRLLVFTSKMEKEYKEGIAYQWNYLVESQYGDEGMNSKSISSRGESSPLNATSKSLVLMNFFPTDPNSTAACVQNSDPLILMLQSFRSFSANRWPNFIAVDFYMMSNAGGAYEAVDIANGQMVCGCDNIANCKINSTFGTCVNSSEASGIRVYFTSGWLFMFVLLFINI